jgi:hypothetical protein
MHDVPQHEYLDFNLQPRDHGFSIDEFSPNGAGGESCDLRVLPHQQQLHFGHCADRLRQLRMPFDHLAAD